jgi:hypothetical protein
MPISHFGRPTADEGTCPDVQGLGLCALKSATEQPKVSHLHMAFETVAHPPATVAPPSVFATPSTAATVAPPPATARATAPPPSPTTPWPIARHRATVCL